MKTKIKFLTVASIVLLALTSVPVLTPVEATTNNTTGAQPPPLPPYTPTPDSAEGIEIQRQIDEAEAYAASLRPSPRVLMEDGRIIKWSSESIEWHIEAPYYRVQWRASMTEGEWLTVGYRSGDKLTHRKAEGFYRVLPAKRPTLPPTHPPAAIPTNNPSALIVGKDSTVTTNFTSRYGGFR